MNCASGGTNSADLYKVIKNSTRLFLAFAYPNLMKEEGRLSQALRVLLVEENPHDARFFKELCQDLHLPLRLHHEVDTARGLERLLGEPYDLLVLSAFLEGSYDLQLLRQVHLALPLLPVVVLLDGNDTHLATKAPLSRGRGVAQQS